MADKSLESLSKAIYTIANDTQKDIKKNVKDIRDAICGSDGILDALLALNGKVDEFQKKGNLADMLGKNPNEKNIEKNRKGLLKNTDNIVSILNKILNSMNKKGFGGSIRGLNTSDFKYDKSSKDKLGNISRSIDIMQKLKGLKLKDFLGAKTKLKHMSAILERAKKIFGKFKNEKEATATISFINSSIDIIKKLAKIGLLSKPAKWGAKAIQTIFVGKTGKGGLLKVFRDMEKHRVQIEEGVQLSKKMAAACGSFLISAIALSAVGLISIPAMLGALAMKGIIWLLVGSFKLLNKAKKSIIKGSAVLLLMSASVITFALGLSLMTKITRNMKLADVGLMIASIAGVGLTMAGIGLLSPFIALGSAVMLLMGASLGILALSLMAWQHFDSKKSMSNVQIAIDGLRDTFGLELGKNTEHKSVGQRLKGGIMDIAMGVLNFGKTFFTMGSILLAGAALGILYVGLLPWQKFDGKKSATNIKAAVGALKDAFGINDRSGESPSAQAKGGLSDLLGLANSIFQMGKTFVTIGTLVFATAMMDIIRLTLIPWNNYNPKNAVDNMKYAIQGLKEAFGLDDKPKSIIGALTSGITDYFALGSSLLKAGDTFITMGTILIATSAMDKIRLNLNQWENYDADKPIANIKKAIHGLKDAFGFYDSDTQSEATSEGGWVSKLKNGLSKVANAVTAPLRMAENMVSAAEGLTEGPKIMATLSNIVNATGAMSAVQGSIEKWSNFDPTKSITNMKTAIAGIKAALFGKPSLNSISNASLLVKTGAINSLMKNMSKNIILDKYSSKPITGVSNAINAIDISKAKVLKDIFTSFSKIKDSKPFDKFTDSVNKFVDACNDMVDAVDRLGNVGENTNTETSSNTTTATAAAPTQGGIAISNVDALAQAVAEAIRRLPINVTTEVPDISFNVGYQNGNKIILTLQ